MARHIEHTRPETLAAARAILRRSTTPRGLTMLELATELGTSKSSAYRWFDGRDDLIEAIIDEACTFTEKGLAAAKTRRDHANAVRLFVEFVPACLFETHGRYGKRDQITPKARTRLDDAVATLHRALIEGLGLTAGLAAYAAATTPPSVMAVDRRHALDAALALAETADAIDALHASEPAPAEAVEAAPAATDPTPTFSTHPTWRLVTAGASATVHVTSNSGDHGRTICNERRPFALHAARPDASLTCRKCIRIAIDNA